MGMSLGMCAACAPAPGDDAGSDAGASPADAGTEDAGFDAGQRAPDAGPLDAGAADAGLDAGAADAGPMDAGFDAGPPREYGLEERPPNESCRLPGSPPVGVPALDAEPAFPSLTLDSPVQLLPLPGTTELVAALQDGRLVRFDDADDAASTATLLDLSDRVAQDAAGGLLGAAFHPAYPADPRAFVSWVADGPRRLVLASYSVDTATGTAAASGETQLLVVEQAAGPHGGGPVFGHDGMLYLPVGDGADPAAADDEGSLLGKVLRLDVDGVAPWVPADNPLVGVGGAREEIWARGFAAPRSCSADAVVDHLFCADRGAIAHEVNVLAPGASYGWPARDGTTCVDEQSPLCSSGATRTPLVSTADGETCAALVGPAYRGHALPELNGVTLFGDACDGVVRGVRYDGVRARGVADVVDVGAPLTGFGVDGAGEPYALTATGVFRVVRSAGTPAPQFPTTLQATGCYADVATRAPAAGLLPFTPRAKLWTDAAHKRRYVAVPDGETLTWTAAGPWGFPVGTVLMKEFLYRDDDADPDTVFPMETRFLIQRAAGQWEGYSYMWNDDRTDGWLLEGGAVQRYDVVEGGEAVEHRHVFPDRAQCLLCHNENAGRVLGLVTGRVNHDHDYDGFVDNQLRSFEHIGLFSAPLPDVPDALPRWPDVWDDAAPLADRARAHLAGNCAHCHQPGGPPQTFIDLSYETPWEEQRLCGETPIYGDLGVPGAQVIKPGSKGESELFLRVTRRGAAQMPPLGTLVRDFEAEALIGTWIDGLDGCP